MRAYFCRSHMKPGQSLLLHDKNLIGGGIDTFVKVQLLTTKHLCIWGANSYLQHSYLLNFHFQPLIMGWSSSTVELEECCQ